MKYVPLTKRLEVQVSHPIFIIDLKKKYLII